MNVLEAGGEHLVDAVLDGVPVAHVENVNRVALLADALDATLTLLKASRVPWQVEIDEGAEALEVQSFAGGVGADEDFNFTVADELLEILALGGLALSAAVVGGTPAAGVEADQLVGQRLLAEFGGEPLGRVIVLGENHAAEVLPWQGFRLRIAFGQKAMHDAVFRVFRLVAFQREHVAFQQGALGG